MDREPENHNKKTVLVVDDDADVLQFVLALLKDTYHVLTAVDGEEGLQQSIDFKPEINLLLSDFHMPAMTGVELATKIAVQRPAIKVLLMSGFPGGMPVLDDGWHFLAKPFLASQLRGLIAGLISPGEESRFQA